MSLRESFMKLFGGGRQLVTEPPTSSPSRSEAYNARHQDDHPATDDLFEDPGTAVAIADHPNRAGTFAEPKPAPNPDPDAADLPSYDLDDELHDPEPAQSEHTGSRAILPPIRSKQELLNELRTNYNEVVNLVRKVDQHLDSQTTRSERMLEIAEEGNTKLDTLPRLVDAINELTGAIRASTEAAAGANEESRALSERISKTATNQLESLQQQTAALQQMQTTIHRSGEAEREMAESIKSFSGTMDSMARSTDDLGIAITTMREGDAERERELAELIGRSQKWLLIAVGVFGVFALGTLAAAITGAI